MLPVRLRPDNWTPPARTPWGGRAIVERIKRDLALDPDKVAWPAIGESWELSFDPAFPSRDAGSGRTLAALVDDAPAAWLGADPLRAARARSLMLKLLDAREVLSLQVHPADDDPALAPDESGKPEGWVVLAREPGAGIWLGLADGVTRESFARAIDVAIERAPTPAPDLDPVLALLNFVPVEVGDAFVIDAGTVHAVGPGVTLLEPQLVRPGRRGVTYRFWDWGRRYDPSGRFDPAGSPRPLHRERSLAVTAWDRPRGPAFVATCRRAPLALHGDGALTYVRALDFAGLRLERVRGDGRLTLPATGAFRALTVVAGALTVMDMPLRAGETLAVPACLGALDLGLTGADLFVLAPA